MAKKKHLKYPKKPKIGASISTMENYLKRCKEIDSENKRIDADNKKREELKRKISGLKRN